ncbi:hypothetical protein [Brevibacillus laterosporus]|nr:hypothetical protein [Brevibacillus laterosporus]ATO48403.1 hypothetical protein BrL25_04335 [Brevibacillus laterosporus DSM 25]AYB36846.1 hypothetical protein D5F52_00290 [Brevibacillus laterosporus]MBG9803181.1 hypothetical protein [Brevibacillus laterosporus]MBM7111386.1 hypothetical protein [Brevibacillus laterosporus]MED2002131.1 hypothetical protein [Brevibacillus laterosporus]
MEIVNNVMDKLKPGTAAVVYVTPKLSENGGSLENSNFVLTHVIQQPFHSMNLAEVQAKIGEKFVLLTELAGGYKFSEAYVDYQEKRDFNADALKAEAEKNMKELIVKELLLTDVLKESTFFYKGEKDKVMVQVRNEEGVGDKISTVGSFDKMEKVKVREK